VNSVPRFENAWMRRTKFPYSARSSAKVIRHAVSIDERRAKFRSDLISGKTTPGDGHGHHRHRHREHHRKNESRKLDSGKVPVNHGPAEQATDRFRRPSRVGQPQATWKPPPQLSAAEEGNECQTQRLQQRLKPRPISRETSQLRANSPVSSICSNVSQLSMPARRLGTTRMI
jgi:uncharacterized protein (DUF2235 family)